jgi:PAS domain S-box-containing protein
MVAHDLTILIADDSPTVVTELTALLATIPRTRVVGSAKDAAQTLQAVLALDPDLLLLDMHMPDQSGLDVLRALPGLGRRTATVMVTNHADAVTRSHALDAGAVAFYDKSRQIPELLADVERRASSPSPAPEPPVAVTTAVDALPVLVVDDDEGFRRTVEDILGLHGFTPRSAPDGRRALTLAQEMTPAPVLAVVDMGLPDTNGLELTSELRKLLPDLQVVILTGNASVEAAVEALRDQSCCDYLVKPVAPDDLVRALRNAEGRWRLERAMRELQETQDLLRTVFAASPLALVVTDEHLHVRLWNPAAESVFGQSAGEVVGNVPPLITAPDGRQARGILEGALRGESATGVEIKHVRQDGSCLDLRLSATGLANLSGGIRAVLAVFEDLTERRRLAAHLQQAQRLDGLGRLAGGIAHDFNNLLAVIRTEADLALKGEALDPELRDGLAEIVQTAARGATLTRQLLSFARRQPMDSALTDPNTVVSDLKRMLERLLGDRVRLGTEFGSDVGQVKVDRGQLEQVLTNLVVNARDATPPGGVVTITTRAETVRSTGSLYGLDTGDWVILSVADTGKGVPAELRSLIFEPFFTTKDRGSGTGLGLATSYGIVRQLGGLIALESEVGKGATFHVCLPRVTERDLEAGRHPTAGPPPSGTETILLVEDHVALRSATRRILERQGYSVQVAGDLAEAWRVADGMTRPFDLIVVDAHLPDGDGRDFIHTFRTRFASVRALLTSGSFELADRDDVAIRFLEKPYTFDALARAVRAAIDEPLPDTPVQSG